MKKLLLLIVFALAMTNVFGATFYWVGASGGAWTTTTNWSSTTAGVYTAVGAAPTTADNVYFDGIKSTGTVGTPASTIYTDMSVALSAATTVTSMTVSSGGNVTLAITTSASAFQFIVKTALTFSGNTSLTTTASSSNGTGITLGDGTSNFTLSGCNATNFLDGNANVYITFNTPNANPTAVTPFFNPNFTAGIGSLNVTRGKITLGNTIYTTRVGLGSNNSQELILAENAVLNVVSNNSSSFSSLTTGGVIDANAVGSKVIIASFSPTICNTLGRIFKPNTVINHFEIKHTSVVFVPNTPMTVKNLVLTSGLLANNTTNNITVENGGTITRSAGKLQIPPIYGTTASDKVNLTIAGTCTADNEIFGTGGKLGTLTVNSTFTYTLNSPALAPGYYLSAFNGGNGYGGTAPIPTISVGTGTLASGTANTFTSSLYNGYLSSFTSTATGIYSSAPTITIPAPTVNAWVAVTAYAINAVVSNSSNYYLCTTASTGTVAQTAPTGTGSTKDAINDGRAKWAYIGTSLITATASLSMLPTSITVDAVNLSGKLSYPNSGTPITLNVTNGLTVNSGGTLNLGAAQGTSVTHLINVGGDISNSGTITTSIPNGKLDFTMNGGAAQTINSTANYNNLTINNAAGVNLGSATTVAGSLALTSGTLSVGANTLTLAGTAPTLTSGSIDASNAASVLAFTNTSAMTLPAGLFNGGISTLTMNGSGGVTLGEGITISKALNLTAGILTNSTLKNITFNGGATPVEITRTAGILTGTYPVFTGVSQTNVTYNNTTSTQSSNELVSDATRIYNLTVNNAGGVIINGDKTVNGTLNLIAGTLTIGTAANPRIFSIKGNSIIRTAGVLNANVLGTVPGTGSSLVFANTTALTLPSGLFSGNIYKMTLNGTGGVTLGGATTVDNALTLTLGTLTTGANTLTINGTTSGTYNIETGSNGTLVYGGASAQTISNLASSAVNNLTIDNAVGVAVNSNITAANLTVNASKILNVNAGKQFTVSTGMTNNGTINLRSTSGGGTATIKTPESITGTNAANVEQYLASSRNWYMSSPVTGATASAGPTYNKYVEALNNGTTWTTVNSGDGFDVMTGYIVKPTIATTYNFNGMLNTGDKTISGLTSTATAKTGFNLVGNPYPSYTKWSEAVKTNLDETMWYRSHDGTNYKFYTYHPVDHAGGIGVPATVTDYIPPMQAFWVKVTASQTGSLQFLNTSRDHQDAAGSVFRAPKANASEMKLLRLQVSNASENDETVLYFNTNASDNLDSYDSQKMFNNNAAIPEIYTTAGAEKLVINGMSDLKYNTEIPLGFVSGQSNSFSIKATELKNFEAGTRIILRDKVDVVDYELNGDNAYTFTSDAVNSTSRFSLLFKSPSVTTDIAGTKNSSTYTFVDANNNIVISAPEKSNYAIYNAVGQLIEIGVTTSNYQTSNFKPGSGVYVVNVNNQTTKVIIK